MDIEKQQHIRSVNGRPKAEQNILFTTYSHTYMDKS